MVKLNIRWKTAEDFNILRGSSAWTKVKYFWRKGWIEIPVIMGSTFGMILGVGMASYTLYYGYTHDMTPKYYQSMRVFRPDDPEVKRIRHTSVFD